MTFHIRSINAIVYWDYEDGMIKRENISNKQYKFPTSLKLDLDILKNQPDDITFYSNLEMLRIALDTGCVNSEIEHAYVEYLNAYGLDCYKMDSYI